MLGDRPAAAQRLIIGVGRYHQHSHVDSLQGRSTLFRVSLTGGARVRVLFTGGGGAGTQALWALLEGRHEVHFCDADTRRISAVVPDDRAHPVPMAGDPSYLATVVRLCREESIDVLVPGVDEELELLARHRDELSPTVVLLPTASFVETMLDKFAFTQALSGVGIRVPHTLPLGSSGTWGMFPAIVKPRRGRGSRGVSVNSIVSGACVCA